MIKKILLVVGVEEANTPDAELMLRIEIEDQRSNTTITVSGISADTWDFCWVDGVDMYQTASVCLIARFGV